VGFGPPARRGNSGGAPRPTPGSDRLLALHFGAVAAPGAARRVARRSDGFPEREPWASARAKRAGPPSGLRDWLPSQTGYQRRTSVRQRSPACNGESPDGSAAPSTCPSQTSVCARHAGSPPRSATVPQSNRLPPPHLGVVMATDRDQGSPHGSAAPSCRVRRGLRPVTPAQSCRRGCTTDSRVLSTHQRPTSVWPRREVRSPESPDGSAAPSTCPSQVSACARRAGDAGEVAQLTPCTCPLTNAPLRCGCGEGSGPPSRPTVRWHLPRVGRRPRSAAGALAMPRCHGTGPRLRPDASCRTSVRRRRPAPVPRVA
jgi:hypothetical protein